MGEVVDLTRFYPKPIRWHDEPFTVRLFNEVLKMRKHGTVKVKVHGGIIAELCRIIKDQNGEISNLQIGYPSLHITFTASWRDNNGS